MFTMGHKALVLNTLRAEDDINPNFKIKGFGDFTGLTLVNPVQSAASTGTLAAADFTAVVPTNAVLGDTVEVQIKFSQNRYVSEYSSDFIKQGDTIIFQSTALVDQTAAPDGLTSDDVAAAIAFGWAAYNEVFNIAQVPPLTVGTPAADSPDFVIAMAADYLNIESVTIKLVPAGAKLAPANAIELISAPATPIAGIEGIGQGKFLEESIRTASYTNMDPYANKPHGSDSVDVRGLYKLYEFEAAPNAGWGYHENLGTAIADQNVTVRPQKFTIYANQADAALIVALNAVVT